MAASGARGAAPAPPRQPRRGPAPFASFDHDVSDESSPESKQTFQLPEIREDSSATAASTSEASIGSAGEGLVPPEQRARSHSTPAVHSGVAAGALQTPAAPRIDISRASSSSHQDSRDSSPELALFAGSGGGGEEARARLELGFREEGALDLRSSTEELAFLEGAPGEPRAPPVSAARRHSRKDSQGSEAALLGVSGRTSRLSSVGSQCSAHSALSGFSHASRVSRLSVVSGVSRSPSPHKMLLETSFCGPKPIETDPEICAAAVEERLIEIAKMNAPVSASVPVLVPPAAPVPAPAPLDTCDRREVRTEVTVESASARSSNTSRLTSPSPVANVAPMTEPTPSPIVLQADDKNQKETRNRARAEERRARSRERREPSEPEVYRSRNRSKDIIRIKLKPDDEYEDDDDEEVSERTLIGGDTVRKPVTLDLNEHSRRTPRLPDPMNSSPVVSPIPQRRPLRESRTPSPGGAPASRKSSFCSLFKSRETIASPDSPSGALRRKKSLNEGRSRSKSRDRSATPTSSNKIKGSVLSLFKTPRRSAASPSPSSRASSPVIQAPRAVSHPPPPTKRGEKLKYYEDTKDGIIHIPLRTPPDEEPGSSGTRRDEPETETRVVEVTTHREPTRPTSAPHSHSISIPSESTVMMRVAPKPIHRTVLPDGSIIIPLHSPTEKTAEYVISEPTSKEETVVDTIRNITAVAQVTPPTTKSGSERTESSSDDARTGDESRSVASVPEEPTPVETSVSIVENDRRKKKERLVFTTHVGSREQVFSTQFSITKTPSVTSDISMSFPSYHEGEEIRSPILRDTHITSGTTDVAVKTMVERPETRREHEEERGGVTTPDGARDSSESEPSSEAGGTRIGNDAEQRGLVVQESFEEELPYVPTTLPMERPLALPMIPVRERGGVRVAGVQRPRAVAPLPPGPPRPPVAPAPAPLPADKLRIRLPRRPRTASASAPPRPERPRTRSGGDAGGEPRAKPEWIDFDEVPERRKQPKRIQTLPATAARDGVLFSYVEPEECRCECHTRQDDELPLLQDDSNPDSRIGSSPLECVAGGEEAHVQLSVQIARPFTGDMDLRREAARDAEAAAGAARQ